MRVFTYRATGPDTPDHMRFAAVMEPHGPGTHWTSVGESEEAARAKLEATWAREKSRLLPKMRPRKKATPKAPVVEDVL